MGDQSKVDTRRLFLFGLPLFLSWIMLTAEGPIIHAALTRLPNPTVSLAAFGIVISLSVTIESPVIMLLSTSTALADSRASYLVLRRYTLWLNILLTGVATLVGFCDPVYQFLVPGLMGIPAPVAAAAQDGLAIMVPWSAAIGWRRFNQGLLIRSGRTRAISWGTSARLTTAVGGAFSAGFLLGLNGVQAGSLGLVSGSVIEALYAWVVSREAKTELPQESPGAPLTMGDVFRFHAPLAATSVMSLLGQPLIGAGIARMANPLASLAAWPVAFAFLLIARSPSFALTEIVIALHQRTTPALLRRFVLILGLVTTGLLALFLITPMVKIVLRYVTGLEPETARFAIAGMVTGLSLPFSQAIKNWLRGLLMAAKVTAPIYLGMAFNLGITGLIIGLGVSQRWPGVATAGAALAGAAGLECLFLGFGARRAGLRL